MAVSFARQRQPQSMRGPIGRPPRLGFAGNFRFVSKTVGRRGQFVKWLRIWLVVSLARRSPNRTAFAAPAISH